MEDSYHKVYNQWRRDVIAWEEREEFLLGEIERLELARWRDEGEISGAELFLIEKIERLEGILKEKDRLITTYQLKNPV